MKTLRDIYWAVSLCISSPIWFYLMYTALAAAHPDRLVWFLFWVYFPLNVCTTAVGHRLDSLSLDERFDRWVETRNRRG